MKRRRHTWSQLGISVVIVLSVFATSTLSYGQEKQTEDEQRQAIFLTAKSLFLNRGYGAVSPPAQSSTMKNKRDQTRPWFFSS